MWFKTPYTKLSSYTINNNMRVLLVQGYRSILQCTAQENVADLNFFIGHKLDWSMQDAKQTWCESLNKNYDFFFLTATLLLNSSVKGTKKGKMQKMKALQTLYILFSIFQPLYFWFLHIWFLHYCISVFLLFPFWFPSRLKENLLNIC